MIAPWMLIRYQSAEMLSPLKAPFSQLLGVSTTPIVSVEASSGFTLGLPAVEF